MRRGVDLVVQVSPGMAVLDWQSLPSWVAFWDLGHRDFPELPEMAQLRKFELLEKTYRIGLVRASKVIAESAESCRKLAVAYGLLPDRFLVVRLVPDVPEDNDEINVSRDPHLAFYPAQFWPHKNHVVLLHALKLLMIEGRQPRHLVLAGSDKGNEKHIRRLTRDLGVEAHVTFAGFVSFERLQEYYRTAAVTVMPSILGPTNLPPLEALAMGCPVAASVADDANSLSDIGITHVKPFDVEGWSMILDAATQLLAPDRSKVREAVEARRQANVDGLSQALDEFAVLRTLWTPSEPKKSLPDG